MRLQGLHPWINEAVELRLSEEGQGREEANDRVNHIPDCLNITACSKFSFACVTEM